MHWSRHSSVDRPHSNATVLSIDGTGAFDMVSRQAMLQGLHTVVGGDAALPFVRQFCGSASTYLLVKTKTALFRPLFTPLCKQKVARRATHSCFLWDNTPPFRLSRPSYKTSACSRSSTMFASYVRRIGSVRFLGFCRTSGSSTLPSFCTTGKPRRDGGSCKDP